MDELDETVLNLQQRQKRKMVLHRYQNKVERAKEIAQKRMATDKNIKKRAYAKARQIVRKRFAGKQGAEYEKLGPSEKIAVDRAIDKKQALIKKIALRLIPRVKDAEQKRLQAFMKGQGLVNLGQPEGHNKVNESFSIFAEKITQIKDNTDLDVGPDDDKKKPDTDKTSKKKSKNPEIQYFNKFGENVQLDTTLTKKSEKSGVSVEVLGEVYNRGLDAWNDNAKVTREQYAFARVNSFINKGKSFYTDDADLQEGRLSFSEKMEETKYVEEGIRKTPWNMGKSKSQILSPENTVGGKATKRIHHNEKHDIEVYHGMQVYKTTPHYVFHNDKLVHMTSSRDNAMKHAEKLGKKLDKEEKSVKEEVELDETIRRVEGGYRLVSKKSGKNLGTYPSKEGAEKRERQVQYFKHQNEDVELDEATVHSVHVRVYDKHGEKQLNSKEFEKHVKDHGGEFHYISDKGVAFKFKHAHQASDFHRKNMSHFRELGSDNDGPVNEEVMKGKDPCWKGYQMVGKKTKNGKQVPNCVPEEVQVNESNNTPYVKPHIEKGSTKQSGWKASNKHGRVKYFGMDFKKSAERHAGIDEACDCTEKEREEVVNVARPKTKKSVITKQGEIEKKIVEAKIGNSELDPAKREVGTDSLVKTYKNDTPGQGGDLNESFNIAFASGVGVTLTAADLGMKAQGGFALHPSVIAEMEALELEEDAVTAEKKPVYMPPRRKEDGSYTPAKTVLRKSGRKITDNVEAIKADSDPHDGQ